MIPSRLYFLGLIIVSICVGTEFKQVNGFFVLGIGIIGYSMFVGLLNYLNKK